MTLRRVGLQSHYPGVETDEFVVMPNHVHGIVVLSERDDEDERDVGAQFIAPHIGGDGMLTESTASEIATETNGVMTTGGVFLGGVFLGGVFLGGVFPGWVFLGAMNRAPTLGEV